ncbi:type II toxin-antitoxin system VapC family toxin [Alienimonas chondri]|uniref:Ribonuclease VapC n=1 Tax=Alienimonas chondri TaxID=2681879 RepID=A0ABX1VJ44_9PLAN|nr:PIN domain-containing protein [Alienimonas chondri]NNJ27257.1 23S rRNA-specific endonuclease VapC20 [Alienimonas chondri]
MTFVDAGPFIARHFAPDQHHDAAVAYWNRLAARRRLLVTSNFVLDEAATLLARKAGYEFAAERARRWFHSPSLTILRPDAHDEDAALEWFTRFADQGVSFTDCISFALMTRVGIRSAFTFDRHFRFAGFEPEPRT